MGFFVFAYVIVLLLVFMSALAAAWSLAFQLFILSCVILIGVLFVRRNKPPPERDDPWNNVSYKDHSKY